MSGFFTFKLFDKRIINSKFSFKEINYSILVINKERVTNYKMKIFLPLNYSKKG